MPARIDLVWRWLVVMVLVSACNAGPGAAPGIQIGRADAAEGAISISTPDWTYSVPLDGVLWVDQMGLHDAGRPACLAPGVSREIQFAAVEVTVQGTTWRPVVWVSCR